ncbi:protein PLANT CADMIUM RESISTANCE 7-like isoform X1 [Quercus lobata]|uniref:protein PLANT CADMIUM RESISTANCE 7-like isoform X1 n=1 Tax=Quercus lobata TaxID=97700 RepID=UPI001245BA9F|nr:protein PLANT CADMIUM RESISTANCE 7-like isoform X1 [Quercus lobata]
MGGLSGSGIYSECCFTSSNAFNIFLTNSIVFFFLSLSKGWVTCVCPCLTFARNAEIVDEGKTSAFTAGRNYLVLCNFVPLLGATLYGCTYRSKLRRRFDLPEQPCSPCEDCCVHHLCCFCALCQEHRELTNRQMDPRGGH